MDVLCALEVTYAHSCNKLEQKGMVIGPEQPIA